MKQMLNDFKQGKITLEEVLDKLKTLPYEDLGFAKIDTHRTIRTGYPEVIYSKGKTTTQILKILKAMSNHNQNILATKADKETYNAIKNQYPDAEYNEPAKTIVIKKQTLKPKKGKILIITAGTSDIPIAEEARVTAELMGNKTEKLYDIGVAGIHRLLDNKEKIFTATVIIVIAGMDGALPSVIGGLARAPVIAVPTSVGYGASF
ncbi:MAG: nickel pincer cofactor biosynthesis protein LarB, partial [Candidatus Aenigmarchaeota archaeon]|nr:nickel pincer cofactor biosynthesis protein LarB [Candidatus Aenigmarchaeota archaeon]